MDMKKLLLALLLSASPAFADDSRITKGYHTMDALGCMLVQECTDGVEPIWGVDYLKEKYPDSDWTRTSDRLLRRQLLYPTELLTLVVSLL